MAKAEKAPPGKGGGMKNLLLLIVIGLVAAGSGFALPMVLGGGHHDGDAAEMKPKHGGPAKPVFVSFGDVVVNIYEERLSRYLRVKLILVVDESQEKQVNEALNKSRAILKNWLISYLCDRTLEEVRGAGGVNRLRREIQDQFNNLLFGDGADKIKDVLFEEFVVQ
jgi:flagellar basal body-associated protein FliL